MDNIDFSSNKAVSNVILWGAFFIGVMILSAAPLNSETKYLYWLIVILVGIVYIISKIYDNSYCKVNVPLCKSPVIQDFEMKKLDDYAGKSAETADLTVICNPLKPKQLQLKKTSSLVYTLFIVFVVVIYFAIYTMMQKGGQTPTNEELKEMFIFAIFAVLTWITYLTAFRATSIGLMQVLIAILLLNLNNLLAVGYFIISMVLVILYRTDLSAGYISKFFIELVIFVIGFVMLAIILYLLYMVKKGNGSTILYTVMAGYILVLLYIIKLYFQCVIRSYYCEPNIKLSPVKNETNTDINIACEAKYI